MEKAVVSLVIAALMTVAMSIPALAQQGSNVPAKGNDNTTQGNASTSITPPIARPPKIQPQAYRLQATADDQRQNHPEEEPIRWTDKVIASFTVVLGLCGIASGVIAYFQWDALKSQVDRLDKTIERADAIAERQAGETQAALAAAQKAASAAELSAQAAIGMEIPRIHIEKAFSDRSLPKSPEDAKKWRTLFSPAITVKNYGRTTAFVSSVVINARIDASIPEDPAYTIINQYPSASVIEAGQPHDYVEYLFTGDNDFTDEHLSALFEGDAKLYVWGKIIYTDFLGKPHERGFIWTWTKDVGSFWDRAPNYPKYDYQT